MWVSADHSNEGHISAAELNEPVKCCRKRIAEGGFKRLHIVKFRRKIQRFGCEALLKKQKLPRGIVGFGLNLIVAIVRERKTVVAKHDLMMPRKQAVTDFMPLIPPVF